MTRGAERPPEGRPPVSRARDRTSPGGGDGQVVTCYGHSDSHGAQRKEGPLRAGEARTGFNEKVLVHRGWKDGQDCSWRAHLSILVGSRREVGLSGTLGRRSPWGQEGAMQPGTRKGLVRQAHGVDPHPRGRHPLELAGQGGDSDRTPCCWHGRGEVDALGKKETWVHTGLVARINGRVFNK